MAAGRTAGWLVLRSSASSSSYAHRLRVRATVAPLLALTSRSRLHTGTWRTAAAWLAPPHEQARGGRMHTTPSACAARPATPGPWRRLPGVKDESDLRLALTLPTGQSFRWRDTGGARSGEVVSEYVGVLGPRVLLLQERCGEGVWYRVLGRSQEAAALTEKEEAHDVQSHLAEYFNLQVSLGDLWDEFSAADERFRRLVPYVRGSRMLRQEPYECLFSFICSQNNHISRIHLMVDRLCARYGTQILLRPTDGVGESCTPEAGQRSLSTAAPPGGYFTFPTEKQLSEATEAELRELGFGYRAKFIVETARALREKEGGGPAWLLRLREGTRQEAIAALCELPGVGPKVAACVSLFSLDQHAAIPVDTHVWRLATVYYAPELDGKSLTPRIHKAVEDAFIDRFGEYAGWAHQALFIAELREVRASLPQELRTPQASEKKKAKDKASASPAGKTQTKAESSREAQTKAVRQRVGSSKLQAQNAGVKKEPVKRKLQTGPARTPPGATVGRKAAPRDPARALSENLSRAAPRSVKSGRRTNNSASASLF